MSYQVLARKWRPKSFGTLVGQEHVVRALSHALATGRLHHAYLFTGTRGVGKTTISRILAKALNCETGVTAEPCGQCEACRAIDADRFPDYVEMDAASNRGVEDMAALLDKAVYAPVQGRYKVYMIDEVHMLTGHAFNAMLKTLEEPPEHVKFILATTDPQKIPVTVLSRCLQFNLKQMPQGHIVEHLDRVLTAEAVPFEPPALRHIAKAANGSMRDALSLLDQAIAHGAGKVAEEQVTHMLGTVGDDHLHAVLEALAAADMAALLAVADGMEARSLSFDAALQALASLLHRVALYQFAPAAITDPLERSRVEVHAAAFDAEFLQLAYQIAIHGREELPLAPDEYTGFTMTLLRLHAFRPEQPPALGSTPTGADGGAGGERRPLPARAPAPAAATPQMQSAGAGHPPNAVAATSRPVPPAATTAAPAPVSAAPVRQAPSSFAAPPAPAAPVAPPEGPAVSPPAGDVPPWEELPPEAQWDEGDRAAAGGAERFDEELNDAPPRPAPLAVVRPSTAPAVAPAADEAPGDAVLAAPQALAAGDWRSLVRALGLTGMLRELAQHCEWVGLDGEQLELRLSATHRHLLDINRSAPERLQEQLGAALGRTLRVRIVIGTIEGETPAQRDEIERRQRHAEAVAALECDPFVRELIERFDATLLEDTVRPL
ncbi:DNA polymerase III subunit gamma/tau [Azoarcus olearius]|uniref:DNA polymerase III subunit gamma/tau n=1 Tax=Azoarcus sp. (strain BH72) TaxID=418699 RepID=A1K419_AZOSB|nr:DNA polymerase III subunit gamma/tau [Azoarcus olearius]CAL93574.1 DNA polymerase III subunit Tau [Azoarcus olearius]